MSAKRSDNCLAMIRICIMFILCSLSPPPARRRLSISAARRKVPWGCPLPLARIQRNPLKTLDSEKEMKGNANLLPCFTGVSRKPCGSRPRLEAALQIPAPADEGGFSIGYARGARRTRVPLALRLAGPRRGAPGGLETLEMATQVFGIARNPP